MGYQATEAERTSGQVMAAATPRSAGAGASAEAPEQVELAIEGMHCASCATRIEKRLNDLEGVTATVNFATEQAAVAFDPQRVSVDSLLAAVRAAGPRPG